MNKFLTTVASLSIGLAMAIGVGVAVASNNKEATPVHATESVYKTALFGSSYNSKGVQDYTSTWTSTNNGFTVSLTNFNNNNNGWDSVKCGRKSNASTGTITTSSAIDEKITKVDLGIAAIAYPSNLTSITLYKSSNNSTWTSLGTFTQSTGTQTVTIAAANQAANLYYKLEFVCTGASKNGVVEINQIDFYHEASTPLTGITLSGAASSNAMSIGSSDLTAKTVSVTLNPLGATDQTVNIVHQSGTSGLFTVSSSATCTSGSGSFTVTGKGNTSGSETFRISGNTETSVYVDLVVTALDDSVTYWTVSFDSDGGDTIQDMSVEDGETFEFPSPGTKEHYSFDGWSSDGGTTKYAAGATSPAVGDDITYTAYWTEDAKVTVTYSAGTNATGSYSHTNQYVGSYSLLALNSLSGITYDSTKYRLKDYVVGGVSKQPGNSITLSVATTVTVNFEEIPLEYTVTFGTAEGTSGITDFSNTSYVIPSGVTLDNIQGNVYSNTSNQAASLRFGKSGTTGSFDASITGDYYITSVTCNLMYYGSDTTATFAVTPNGGSAISKSLTGDWADYTYDVSAAKAKKVTLGTDANGKRAYLSGFTITYAVLKTLSNIALSGTYPTTFTKGDTFSHAGMVVTANYSDSTNADVTSSATWSSPDMSTPGAKTITVSYSDEYGSASKTYSITVSYAAPTSISLSSSSASVALEETFNISTSVTVTVNPSATADQTAYAWSLYDDGDLVEDTDYAWISPEIVSYKAGTFVFRCTSTEDGTKYAEFTLTVSGEPLARLKDGENKDVTNGSATVFADAGTISYSVTTENFQGTLTYTWSSSNTSIISVDTAADDMCDYEVKTAGSSRLSCRIQGSVKGDVTVYVDVTVSAVSVTSVSWTAPTINVYSGATLTSSDVSSWNVKYNTDSGKTDQTAALASIVVKVGGSAVSLPYTWQASDDNKTLGVEYGGVSSSTTTVAVTQSINAVNAPVPGEEETKTWTATGAANLGAVIANVDETDTGSVTFDDDSTMSYERTLEYVASGKNDYMAFTNDYIQFGSSNALEKLVLTATTSGTVTSVVVDCWSKNGGSNLTVTVGGNAFDTSKACPSAGAEVTFTGSETGTVVITMEKSTKTSGLAQYIKSVAITTVEDSGETTNIANSASHKAAQRVAVKFAKAFNDAMDDTENCTTGLSAAWSTCSSAYDTFKSEAAALGETEEAYAKNLIKYATAQYSDDSGEACIERMLKTYEICVTKHGQTAFMSDLLSSGARVTPLAVISANSNTAAVVVIISLISAAAIGGYFFLRKKKED